jgi:hypothetical protein
LYDDCNKQTHPVCYDAAELGFTEMQGQEEQRKIRLYYNAFLGFDDYVPIYLVAAGGS